MYSSLSSFPSIPGLRLCLSGHLFSSSESVAWRGRVCCSFQNVQGLVFRLAVPRKCLSLTHGCLCSNEADRVHSSFWFFLCVRLLIMASSLLGKKFKRWGQIRVSEDLVARPDWLFLYCLTSHLNSDTCLSSVSWHTLILFEMQVQFAQIPPYLQCKLESSIAILLG